jgi:hypothetical protein
MARLATQAHEVLSGPEDSADLFRVTLAEWQYEQLSGWSHDDLIEMLIDGTPGLPTTLEETCVWVNEWVAADSLEEWANGPDATTNLTDYLKDLS